MEEIKKQDQHLDPPDMPDDIEWLGELEDTFWTSLDRWQIDCVKGIQDRSKRVGIIAGRHESAAEVAGLKRLLKEAIHLSHLQDVDDEWDDWRSAVQKALEEK